MQAICPNVWKSPIHQTPSYGINQLTQLDDESKILATIGRLSKEKKWVILLNPPRVPSRAKLAKYGIDFTKVLVVKAKQNVMLALSQALSSGTARAVLAWIDDLPNHEMDGLNQASLAGHSHGWIIHREQSTPSSQQPHPHNETTGWQDKLQLHLPLH